ncbi:AAA family ATPase [Micrococcus porci]|uniref:AAA family ATPase n=1 Tax=Micrococcus porci TaxID=2856555 RepID=UPI003CF647F2
MLLLIFGPPAVGKMAVGRAVAAASDFRLFHNHMTIEPLLEVFGHGTEPFNVLTDEFRIRVIEEAARAGVDLAFTLVWDVTDPDDAEYVARCVAAAGDDAAFVELRADLATRLERNRTEERLLHKPSKRNLEWSDGNVREMEATWTMTTADGPGAAEVLLGAHPHLVLQTDDLTAEETAGRILAWLADVRG